MRERRASFVTDSNETDFVSNVRALGCEQAPELRPLQESFAARMKNFEELASKLEKSSPTAKHGWGNFSFEPENIPSPEIPKKNASARETLANVFTSLAAKFKGYEDALKKECSERYFGLPVYLDRRHY